VLLATASAIIVLALIVAAFFCLRSYRPTRVPVVERARVPHDMRAKVNTGARLRLRLLQQRRTGRGRPPTAAPGPAPISAAVSTPTTAPVRPTPAPPDIHPLALVQRSLAHNRKGAPRPGSYFRIVEAPSQESITSDVRGPWAAQIVTRDGRITLPDSDADVPLGWGGTE
jgi:hypothetical protein